MAIALDAVSSGTSATNSLTVSHTCTGTFLVLIVSVYANGVTDASGYNCSYNGVSMTRIVQKDFTNGSSASFILVNPATGSHNIVTSIAGASVMSLAASSYTGARQVSQPDASASGLSDTAQTSLTGSNTSVADNCWTILCAGTQGNGQTASTGSTQRAVGAQATGTAGIYDSNGAKTPAGAVSMSVTFDSARYGYSILSIAPILAVTVSESMALTEGLSFIRQLSVIVSDTLHVFDLHIIRVTDAIGVSEAYFSFKNGFSNIVKSVVATFTNQSKNSSSFTNQSKNSSTWTNQSKT